MLHGFKKGFSINATFSPEVKCNQNLKSAINLPNIVKVKIDKEISLGRIKGPFLKPPIDNAVISPIGLQPKKNPGEYRLIQHLSYPKGLSVNDSIPKELASVSYSTVSNAINAIKKLGRGCYMAKTDIKNAYRIIPIKPDHHHLLCFKFQDSYYVDTALPMGCRISAAIFEEFSTALEWIALNKSKASEVVHILDDFLFLAPNHAKCSSDLSKFLVVCDDLGVPIAQEKTVEPCTRITFMGIELDSVEMVARLPKDKIVNCQNLIKGFLKRKSVTLREMQVLLGTLNFACSVLIPGRAFLRRLIDLTLGITKPFHYIRLTKETKKDLGVWLGFLAEYNCKSFFLDEFWATSDSLNLHTDASGTIGFGGFLGNKWFHGTWQGENSSMNIAILELYPIVLAIHLFGYCLANKRILFSTDNLAIVHVLNKQTSKDKNIMCLMRNLVRSCLDLNILFRAKHIPGVFNTKADALSRLQIEKFRDLAPEAATSPETIPPHLSLTRLLRT